jgi:penicillin-binding protein 1A
MRKSVRILWRIFLFGSLAFLLVIGLVNWGVFGKMPSLTELENPSASLASEVYAADGTLMGKYYLQDRSPVEYKDISKHVINALIATEDERFYDHSGIDGKSLIRAIVRLGKDGGGSTITQQLAKNLLDQGSANKAIRVLEKLKEWIVAIKLERNFTKEEIITLYLNTVSYGDNIFGIRNAAKTFFQKEPDRLNIDEAAVLVGLLKGNTIYNPRRNPEAAFARRNTVIEQMVKNNFLTTADAAAVKVKPIQLNYKKLDENAGIAPYFRDVLRDELKQWCKKNKKADGSEYNLFRDGLKIYTTINPRMQLYAEEAVAKHIQYMQKILNSQNNIRTGSVWKGHENIIEREIRNSERWKNLKEDGMKEENIRKTFYQKTNMKVFAWNSKREKDTLMTPLDSIKYHRQMLQSGFLAMDPVTGEVKAWVGSIDFKTFKFDHVNINTKRQVGSSIKPLLYCQAVRDLNYGPETVCENVRQNFPGYGWVPASGNAAGGGTRPMAYALAKSLNNVAAFLMKEVQPKNFVQFLKDCNIQTEIKPYPSICLGSSDISLFEMLWSYTMFPSKGVNTQPVYMTRIEDKNGNILKQFTSMRKVVISDIDAYTMCKMMQGTCDFGTARGLRGSIGVAEMGGKTGTTNDNSDAWFIGYTPQLLAGTWVGCDDRFIRFESTSVGQGGFAAMPIFRNFYQKAFADKTLGLDKTARFFKPENLNKEAMYDYMLEEMQKQLPPGAEGEDIGNGEASDYGGGETPIIDNNDETVGGESQVIIEDKKAPADNKNNPPADQKDNKQTTPAPVIKDNKQPVIKPPVKPGDKSVQKPAAKPAAKPPAKKPANDY